MSLAGDLQKAATQMWDPAFRSVLWRAVLLAFALLFSLGAGLVWIITLFVPADLFDLSIAGIQSADTVVAIFGLVLVLVLSAVLMVPAAALFVGIFLDRVADAVEARYYPGLAPNVDVPLRQSLAMGAKMAVLILAANLVAQIAYGIALPLAPFLYWGLNGYLLGREFFQQAAIRRMPVAEAHALRRANRAEIWAMGTILALPMSIPIVNLVVPVFGAAAFTHLFHRVWR